MEASDCFQIFRGWLPGWMRESTRNCRLNLCRGGGKTIFSITAAKVIAFAFLAHAPRIPQTPHRHPTPGLESGLQLNPQSADPPFSH
jgi:hypothetical protein